MKITYRMEDGMPIAVIEKTRRNDTVTVYSSDGSKERASTKYVDSLPFAKPEDCFELKRLLQNNNQI